MTYEQRKCVFTDRTISLTDRKSVQIMIANLNSDGLATREKCVLDICGAVRENGTVDSMLTQLMSDPQNIKQYLQ